ncbi:MAG: hypothetical protein JRN52_07275 [Nitrososphaerota archaeon]|nr:hypothetical protein [Nitrososphaerota archaeon]
MTRKMLSYAGTLSFVGAVGYFYYAGTTTCEVSNGTTNSLPFFSVCNYVFSWIVILGLAGLGVALIALDRARNSKGRHKLAEKDATLIGAHEH